MSKNYQIGLIGCGSISDAYIRGLQAFSWLELSTVSDVDVAHAEAKAREHGVKGCSVEELLADDKVNIVVNLTVPAVHAEVSLKALGAGKHVYSEKPLAITREDGRALLAAADAGELRLGCAPDTFLGGGVQSCRKLIDEGAIGEPLSASAFMLGHGVETWHPNPFFFFKYGGHPLFDMGPYYLTALINLLGPVGAVVGLTMTNIPKRTVSSEPHAGTVIEVDAPIHATALLELASGKPVTMIVSGEVVASGLPHIEIYGSEGTLNVPDPNTFGGPVRLKKKGDESWREVPLTHAHSGYDRGGAGGGRYGPRTAFGKTAPSERGAGVSRFRHVAGGSRRFGREALCRGGEHLRAARSATIRFARGRTRCLTYCRGGCHP